MPSLTDLQIDVTRVASWTLPSQTDSELIAAWLPPHKKALVRINVSMEAGSQTQFSEVKAVVLSK